jgi:hypothetical protein
VNAFYLCDDDKVKLNKLKMKRSIILIYLVMLSLGLSSAFGAETDKKNRKGDALPVKTENKLTAEELNRLTRRVEEIRDIDKSELTAKEKKELKKELKAIKANVKADGGYVYIGAGTLLVIILLVILLL